MKSRQSANFKANLPIVARYAFDKRPDMAGEVVDTVFDIGYPFTSSVGSTSHRDTNPDGSVSTLAPSAGEEADDSPGIAPVRSESFGGVEWGNRLLSSKRFVSFSKALLVYTLLVILWGAFVRATGSGAGCGSHWPDCNGEVIPRTPSQETLIEFTHRATSGIFGLWVLVGVVFAFRAFPKGHQARTASVVVLGLGVAEALLGMMLVKMGWVADDDSVHRAIAMASHLATTFLLLAAITWMILAGNGLGRIRLTGNGALGAGMWVGLSATMLLGISGAVTALGGTLFPETNIAEAIQRDLSPTAHFLIRLRILHPMIAVSVGLLLVLLAGLAVHLRKDDRLRYAARWVVGIFIAEMALGLVNLLLHAPVGMQLVHLLMADLLWIAICATSLYVFRASKTDVAASEPLERRPVGDLIRAYVGLTKPRVVSLLLFTTVMAMFPAAGGWPGLGLFLAVLVGGYFAAGAANAINMVVEQDLDVKMERTSKRPIVSHVLSAQTALRFAFILASASFGILWWAANLMAAMLALAGLAFYVVIYTLLLKRRTWQNIVIGGAAGAFPPLVGWASVTGELTPLAWYLFAIIFVWTPVHFWALAILIKDDYAAAGVPMAPIAIGERATVVQIVFYGIVTAIVSILPVLQPGVGTIYLVGASLLNIGLIVRCLQLLRDTDRPQARSLFKYSMAYLAILFVIVALDWRAERSEPIEAQQRPAMTARLMNDSTNGYGQVAR
ncbi:MAG: Protoheme IX farnesyltransferase [Fimbriimonadaceae bacterium]|nr:Protoheme IX farnesyltransferase [Fimbriimonadaceae bacterium]